MDGIIVPRPQVKHLGFFHKNTFFFIRWSNEGKFEIDCVSLTCQVRNYHRGHFHILKSLTLVG